MEEAISTGGAAPEVEKLLNVLVAIDDSDESSYALRWTLDRILKPKSVTDQNSTVVTIAHVVEPLPRYAFPGGYGLSFF